MQEGSPVCLFSKLKERRFPSVDEVLSRLADALQVDDSASSSEPDARQDTAELSLLVCQVREAQGAQAAMSRVRPGDGRMIPRE